MPDDNPVGSGGVSVLRGIGALDGFQHNVKTDNSGNLQFVQIASSAAASTATVTRVASSASDQLLLATNTFRKGAVFYNESTQILYLLLGTSVSSATNYTVQIPSQGYFELPPPWVYNGQVRGIWAAANGACQVTELT
jgi:hypothetical protein